MQESKTGYVIEVVDYQRSGSIYKTGFYGEEFYDSLINAEVYEEEDLNEQLKILRETYIDGTVVFIPFKIVKEININLEPYDTEKIKKGENKKLSFFYY